MADNIKLIYAGTFYGHNNLTEIVLSSNTPTIGSGFFSNVRVKAIIVPDTCTKIDASGIGLQIDYCYLSLSKSLIEISYTALSLNTDTVCIPNSEGIICKSNFLSNTNMAYWYYKHVIVPDTAVLDSSPFSTTTRVNLTYLRLPKTTTNFIELLSSAFAGCSSLRRINLPEGLQYLQPSCFEGCSALEYIEIPSTVRYVNGKNFKDCTSLKEVKFLDDGSQARIYIEPEVFSGCKSLEKVTLPVNNLNILITFASMFKDCYALKEVNLPESVITSTDTSYLYQNCRALKKAKIPSGVITVGSYCFDGCASLEEVELPDNVVSILGYAFQNCYSLKRINSSVDGVANLPTSLERIYEYAFSNCKSLSKVNLSKTLTSLGNYAFYSSGLTEIDYSKSQLATGAYSYTKISEITLGAFPKEFVRGCSKLRKVTVESGYSPTSIEEACFQSSGILSLEIPASVTSLKANALASCSSLQSLKFLGSTPPTATTTSWWTSLPTTCKIYVPQGSLSAYTSKANFPPKNKYTYVEY